MKIMLVQPAKPEEALGGEDFSIFEPLALEYLAAGVASDQDVRILDMRLEDDFDLLLRDFQPDVVGITSYTVHLNTVKRLFRRIKESSSEMLTVVGGHHATVMPADFCTPDIDMLVVGEGVFVFREVIRRLEKKLSPREIPGACCEEDGSIVVRQEEQSIDLDALPFPRRDLTADYRKHYFSEWMRPWRRSEPPKGVISGASFARSGN